MSALNETASNWFVAKTGTAIDYPQADHTGGAFSTSTFATNTKPTMLDSFSVITDPATATGAITVNIYFLGLVTGSGASWTNGSSTLTLTNAFTNYVFQTGDKIDIVSGTSTTVGTYTVSSRTDASNIVLTSSIGALASNVSFVLHGIYATWIWGAAKNAAVQRGPIAFAPNGQDTGVGFGIHCNDAGGLISVLCNYRIRS